MDHFFSVVQFHFTINDFFKKIIVVKTMMKPWIDDDGIVHIGLYEFLLNENSLEL